MYILSIESVLGREVRNHQVIVKGGKRRDDKRNSKRDQVTVAPLGYDLHTGHGTFCK